MAQLRSSLAQHNLTRRQLLTRTARFGVGLAGLSLLASCRGAPSGQTVGTPAEGAVTPGGSVVEISMMGWGSPLERDNVQKGLEQFQAQHPNIRVNWIHVPEDYATKLLTALGGGNAPDVFWATNMRDYVARGVVFDITDRLKQDPVLGKPDYFIQPQEEQRCTVEGKWYGIGSCWVLPHLYYNADLLEKAGIEPPSPDPDKAWTWEQFLEIARELTIDGNGKHPGESGFDPNNVVQWGVSWDTYYIHRDALVYANGGQVYTDDHVCHLGEPEALEALQLLADLMNTHRVAPHSAVAQQLGMDAWQMLASGKVALLCDGSWALQDISKMNFRFGCGVLPKLKTVATVSLAHLHMIYRDTQHPDEAWELLKFLSSDDYQLSLIKAGLWLPSHTSLLTEEGVKSWLTPGVHPEGYELIATKYLVKHAVAYYYPAGFDEANRLITTALDPVWIGEATVEDALVKSGVIDQVNQVLQESKQKLDAAV